LARPLFETLTIHRSAARLGEAQKTEMSEPHISKPARSARLSAATKGGSLSKKRGPVRPRVVFHKAISWLYGKFQISESPKIDCVNINE
jgi:hypothetical protein